MPRTVEHLVETHRLAAERRAAGKPIWARRLDFHDVWADESLTFAERRAAIVGRLRRSPWVCGDDGTWLAEVVDELAAATTTAEWDEWWGELYDIADVDRVWIVLH